MTWRSDWIALRGELRRAREAAGLRQVDVAAHLRLSVRHFARMESAEIDPQARILFAWADVLSLRLRMEKRTDMSGRKGIRVAGRDGVDVVISAGGSTTLVVSRGSAQGQSSS